MTVIATILAVGLVQPSSAQVADWQTSELDGVGVQERLGAEIPMDLEFRDPEGTVVRLGDLFDGERPTILTFNYANCPQLCGLQLNGFVSSLKEMDSWSAGDQFRIITISLDPSESDDLTQRFRERILDDYGSAQARQGWSFLRGEADDIRSLADTVGFGYNSFEDKGQYAHTAALILLDPEGKVARYLYGIEFLPSTLRLSLAETASSKYVSTVDALILRCFLYDAASGTFVADAWKISRIVLSILALILFAFLGWMFRLERRVRNKNVA